MTQQLDQQLSTLQPNCCRHEGLHVAALYPNEVRKGDSQPIFIDGVVVKVEADMACQCPLLYGKPNRVLLVSARRISGSRTEFGGTIVTLFWPVIDDLSFIRPSTSSE
jgi:hypothetical protein